MKSQHSNIFKVHFCCLFSLASKKKNTITNLYRERVGRLCEASHVSVRRERLLRRTYHFVYTHINIVIYGKAD